MTYDRYLMRNFLHTFGVCFIAMFGLVAVFGWRIFAEPRPLPPAKPKQPRRRRPNNLRRHDY